MASGALLGVHRNTAFFNHRALLHRPALHSLFLPTLPALRRPFLSLLSLPLAVLGTNPPLGPPLACPSVCSTQVRGFLYGGETETPLQSNLLYSSDLCASSCFGKQHAFYSFEEDRESGAPPQCNCFRVCEGIVPYPDERYPIIEVGSTLACQTVNPTPASCPSSDLVWGGSQLPFDAGQKSDSQLVSTHLNQDFGTCSEKCAADGASFAQLVASSESIPGSAKGYVNTHAVIHACLQSCKHSGTHLMVFLLHSFLVLLVVQMVQRF